MNYWEREQKYRLAFIDEMVKYAEKINPDHESKEFADALEIWVKEYADKFKAQWNNENPE